MQRGAWFVKNAKPRLFFTYLFIPKTNAFKAVLEKYRAKPVKRALRVVVYLP